MTRSIRTLAPALAIPALLAGCSEGTKAAIEAKDRPLHVTCYSGGSVVLDDYSTRDVDWGPSGIVYRSSTTKTLVKAGADCIVVDEARTANWKPLLPGRTR